MTPGHQGRDGYWFNMACFNGLSKDQQVHVVEKGYLPWGYVAMGECDEGATVSIETEHDKFPGPRFYCVTCAIVYLAQLPT